MLMLNLLQTKQIYREFVEAFNEPSLSTNHRQLWTGLLKQHNCEDLLVSKSNKWTSHTMRQVDILAVK